MSFHLVVDAGVVDVMQPNTPRAVSIGSCGCHFIIADFNDVAADDNAALLEPDDRSGSRLDEQVVRAFELT